MQPLLGKGPEVEKIPLGVVTSLMPKETHLLNSCSRQEETITNFRILAICESQTTGFQLRLKIF